ncbi:M13 family metallopeptidase [Longispora albida]|uniref:M13 family metallopeptidase n=1 Tax=Longispora albida TaxID=203523 RepID=UPI00035C31DF|nr:M13-type metalloendopeptidase [Longispora albida]
MRPGVRAQDDLFAHVNGRWLDEHEIPADRAVDGTFRALADQAELDVRELVEAAAGSAAEPGSPERKIGDLYASFMDTAAVEASGLEPLAGELAAIRDAADRRALAAVLGQLHRTGVDGALTCYVLPDAKNSQRYLLSVFQSGLGLPDESYYREDRHADLRAAYVEHIGRMFTLAGVGFDATAPARVFELERELAAGHWDVVTCRNAELGYNLYTFDRLVAEHPGFDWAAWAAEFAAGTQGPAADRLAELVVRQPGYVAAFTELWAARPLADWQAWATWRLVRSRAQYLTAELVDEDFAFYGNRLSGATELPGRWKRGVALVESLLGEAAGQLFVARHFPPESKARMAVLVENLREAYRRSITGLDWMGAATKTAALAKLDSIALKIGYPQTWRDYTALAVDPADLIGNVRRGRAFEHDRILNKLGRPVDRDEWVTTPQTVNAFHRFTMNDITFPAAILRPPFFDPEADDAANYGAIGAVIGHEIGHAFDDQGAKYDSAGNLVDWWTDADRAEFGVRTGALIAQYDQYSPRALPGQLVNGALTVGENIGDLGGLSIALEAYRIALGGAQGPVLDGFTGLQRVFLSWAQAWRLKYRDEHALVKLATDPHAPAEFRCNGVVRNIDAFYQAFDVQPGDDLYLAPADRVRIW